MGKNIKISVYEVVGSPLCVASGDGQKIYERLVPALEKNISVKLSFENVSTLTSAFLNAAIGQLYGSFKEEQIQAHLQVEDMQKDDLALLKRVVDTAKEYFKNPKVFEQAMQKELGEESSVE